MVTHDMAVYSKLQSNCLSKHIYLECKNTELALTDNLS